MSAQLRDQAQRWVGKRRIAGAVRSLVPRPPTIQRPQRRSRSTTPSVQPRVKAAPHVSRPCDFATPLRVNLVSSLQFLVPPPRLRGCRRVSAFCVSAFSFSAFRFFGVSLRPL